MHAIDHQCIERRVLEHIVELKIAVYLVLMPHQLEI